MTWPTSLEAFIQQQLTVVRARVPDICEAVTRALLVCLPDFRARLEQQVLKINTKQPSEGFSILRLMTLAALVNDFARFAEALTEVFRGYTDLQEVVTKDVAAFTEVRWYSSVVPILLPSPATGFVLLVDDDVGIGGQCAGHG